MPFHVDLAPMASEIRHALAPNGTLRAAINMSNFLLVSARSPENGPAGVSPDMAAAIAACLDLKLEYVTYPNPGALAALFQQGQIDISPGNFNAIQILKAKGVPVAFVTPKEGAIGFKTTMHIVKNSSNKELAFKLIEAALSPEVQGKLMEEPYLIVPTNTKVAMNGAIAKELAKDQAELQKKFVFQDWKTINEYRPAWIARFNREINL